MKVAVVGSGVMGRGIAQLFAQSDEIERVVWKGTSLPRLDKAQSAVKAIWKKGREKGKFSEEQTEKFSKKLFLTADYEDLAGSDLIIEAVAEDMGVKKSLLAKIANVIGPDTIVATNTSSLSVTELSQHIKDPSKFIGLHFFNPAPVMKLTEVIAGMLTSDGTLSFALTFAKKLGKEAVTVQEAPGFVVNRMLIPMINEAVGILAEGVASAEEIDTAMMLGANHPIGPLALADLIGNDVNLSIMDTLYKETGDSKYRAHPLLRKMVRAGRLGRKSGQGFFNYAQ